MDLRYVFACGIVWRYTADAEAGWELIRALADWDGDVQELAAMMLADEPRTSMDLLNAAVAAGAISGADAAEAFAALVAKAAEAGASGELPALQPPVFGSA
jgi:hypothetical protein